MEALRDLNILAQEVVQNFNDKFDAGDRKIPQTFKNKVKGLKSFSIVYNEYSVVIKGDGVRSKDSYVPNQSFFMASFFIEYSYELSKYKQKVLYVLSTAGISNNELTEFFTHERDNGKDDISNGKDRFVQLLDNINYNEADREFLIRFVTDYNWWSGSKTIDRSDFFNSPVLSIMGLTASSNAAMALIVDYLTQNPDDCRLLLEQFEHTNQTTRVTESQVIYYGAPGTGKSHEIKVQTQGDDTVIRTTFHPDSDYSTFVGCYKPTKESTSILSLHKLHAIYPGFKSKAIDRPLHRFIAKYHDSFRLLTVKEAESVFDKYETPSTVSAETSKIMSAIEEIPSTQTITYSFVKQAFTKAYVQAWEKMCRTTPSATPTATIPADSAISPYFQTGKIGLSNEFIYDPQVALSDEEKELLLRVDNFDFPFEEIDNLAELHKDINVVVTNLPQDDKRYHKEITFTAKDIRELYALWESDKERYAYLKQEQGLLWIIYHKLLREKKLKKNPGEIIGPDPLVKLKKYTGESVTIEINESYTLLGKYVPDTKTVYLYKNNIKIWGYDKELELLCAVYIHEMFHAYFDMVPHQTISEIEEPIVECCTLCFLELFDNAICKDYLKHVERKQQSSAICYYGFGAYLYENRNLDWMKLYQNGVGKINSYIVNQYRDKFFPAYRFAEEQETMDILYSILNPQSKKVVFDKSAQFLIIEEINRGNCAQIFGDLFQLLDRNDYGYSEYPIVPDDDLKNALAEDFAGLTLDVEDKSRIDAIFSENYPAGITDKVLSGELLVLPENLYIWATMNTSDQSLFPIDSAFKRRWDWKYMKIRNHPEENYKIKLSDKEYDWWEFIQRINEIIASMTSSADKQLGYFFCKATEGNNISPETFVSKVIFYLWNDVFKDYGFEDESLFSYKEIVEGKEERKELTFPDFYDEDGEKVNEVRLKGFLDSVMNWKKDNNNNNG